MTEVGQSAVQQRRLLGWTLAVAVFVLVVVFLVFAIRPLLRSSSIAPGKSAMPTASGERVRFDLPIPEQGAAVAASKRGEARLGSSPRLLDVASAAGLQFQVYCDMASGRFFLPENMGGGAAWLDFDGDGWLDLFFANGCRLPLNSADREHVQKLFRQVTPGQFEAVEDAASVSHVLFAQGCTAGDVDNDGFPDLVVTAYGNVTLLANNGDGTFTADVQNERIDDPGWSTCAGLGDVNRDGNLDLYVAHYAIVSLDNIPECLYDTEEGKARGYCGPGSYVPESHALLLNRGDGAFTRFEFSPDVLSEWGKGLGVVIADLNGDDWPEIYVANDMDANFLFQNQGNEPGAAPDFKEVGMRSGAALSGEGRPEASMGVACADFDGDLDPDLFLTHYHREKNTYYENTAPMSFVDRSSYTGLAAPSLPFLGFGTVPIDYDLDGWQDLFVANGHVLGPKVKPFGMRSQLFRNSGKARFVEVTSRAGPFFFEERVSRGTALADYDNDGDEDLIVTHLDDRQVSLLRNDTQRHGQPLGIELIGTRSPRSGIGATLFVREGDQTWMRSVVGGGSYVSASDPRILVGIAATAPSATVEVHWPSGEVETWPNLKPKHYCRLVEGTAKLPAPSHPIAPAR